MPVFDPTLTGLVAALGAAYLPFYTKYIATSYSEAKPLIAQVVTAAKAVIQAGMVAGAHTSPAITPEQAGRSANKLAAMSPPDQAAVKALIAAAPSERHKQSLNKAVAAGYSAAELATFAGKIAPHDEQWLQENTTVACTATGTGIQQQFHMSCNATTVQAVRAAMDPVYALKLHEDNPDLDKVQASAATSLAVEQKAMLESASGPDLIAAGLPTDAGLAVHRSAAGGGVGAGRFAVDLLNKQSDVTGLRYENKKVDAASRDAAVDTIGQELTLGRPVPLIVGATEGGTYHYVLAVGTHPGPPKTFFIHDPGLGITVARTEAQIKGNAMNLPSGWSRLTMYEKPTPV